jgi:hypothetical protein
MPHKERLLVVCSRGMVGWVLTVVLLSLILCGQLLSDVKVLFR